MDSSQESRFIGDITHGSNLQRNRLHCRFDSCVTSGTCAKCLGRVMEKGCTAMDKTYHQKCFVCTVCCKQLYGSPYYTMNGKPYCEEDYLSKLEKCSVCKKPILDKTLKAQGHIFHPDCFRCHECHKCLDGKPFSTDTRGNVLCMDDYKKKCAPRCFRCKQPITPPTFKNEVERVVAMGHDYHTSCYRCEDCGVALSSEKGGRGCYPIGERLFCLNCHKRRKPTTVAITP